MITLSWRLSRQRERGEREKKIMPSLMATLLRWRTHSARTKINIIAWKNVCRLPIFNFHLTQIRTNSMFIWNITNSLVFTHKMALTPANSVAICTARFVSLCLWKVYAEERHWRSLWIKVSHVVFYFSMYESDKVMGSIWMFLINKK